MRFRYHVFVCENGRPDGGRSSCGGRGAAAVSAAFAREIAQSDELSSTIGLTAANCLGPCFDGPNVVIYGGEERSLRSAWYANVTPEDVPEITQVHLASDTIVSRLLLETPDGPADLAKKTDE